MRYIQPSPGTLAGMLQASEWKQMPEMDTPTTDQTATEEAERSPERTYASYEALHPDEKSIADTRPTKVDVSDVIDTLSPRHAAPY